jgi:hypothetical protein
MTDPLLPRVGALLARAERAVADPAAKRVLAGALDRLGEPLRVAIAGKVKAGKSTLLNAMVGEELAPTDAGECTRIVTWYRNGPRYRVALRLADGTAEQRPFDRVFGAIRVDLGGPAERVGHIEVEVPSRRLRQHTLIDTPGIASLSTDVSGRTLAFLEADDERAAPADAVVYLLRHMHASDLRFLEAFHGDDVAHGSPVNAIGVLSRADEIGGCRIDAMTAAGKVATRYQADERMRRLCPIVVPVAGLLGVAGATIREDEFRTLAVIARAPLDDVVELLLTADRFVSAPTPVPVAELPRRTAFARLGLFGIRLAVQLIRAGTVSTADDLAKELTARSGLDRLRGILASHFVARAGVLKARSALAALDSVVRADNSSGAAELATRAEEIRASAHEFVELRLLHLLRSARLPGRPDQLAELERLLGGAGAEPAARLGLPAGAVPERVAAATAEMLARWQRIAEHPLTVRELRSAARAATRTCEGILAALPNGAAA